jgi:hypothetical protein
VRNRGGQAAGGANNFLPHKLLFAAQKMPSLFTRKTNFVRAGKIATE